MMFDKYQNFTYIFKKFKKCNLFENILNSALM